MILASPAPLRAAVVACPERREWPANTSAGMPTRSAYLFTTKALQIIDAGGIIIRNADTWCSIARA
jgi:hypothetical protein